MDIVSESYSKTKSFKTSTMTVGKIDSVIPEPADVDEDKSTLTMTKVYSTDRINFDLSSYKTESQVKCMEQPSKQSKLYRTSSITLDKDQFQYDKKYVSKVSFGDRTIKTHNETFSVDILEMKKYALKQYIQENPKVADLKWSLFCAACHSYRYDSVLRPFPPMYLVDDDIKDIDKLRDIAESCPAINVVYEELQNRALNISLDLLNLLYWVLVHVREPQLKMIPKDLHGNILSKVASTTASAMPQYIFQVIHNHKGTEKFAALSETYRTVYAFHGSRLDNFFSILNYGLRISFSKISAYGPGIYLSSEMNVTLPYSQAGFSWGGSFFGNQIAIVALCEMIDHPDVKYSNAPPSRRNHFDADSKLVPPKYFIVQNSDLISVKYILLYCNNIPQPSPNQLSTTITWLQQNKVIAVVVAYVFLLLAIATSNSSTLYKFYKRWCRKGGVRW